ERVEALSPEPLAVAELRVARAHVVGAGVTGNDLQRPLDRDGARRAADHDRELGLGVDVSDPVREHDRVAVATQRVCELAEEERRLRRLGARLSRVVAVVEPDADDFRLGAPEAPRPLAPDRLVAHPPAASSRPRTGVDTSRAAARPGETHESLLLLSKPEGRAILDHIGDADNGGRLLGAAGWRPAGRKPRLRGKGGAVRARIGSHVGSGLVVAAIVALASFVSGSAGAAAKTPQRVNIYSITTEEPIPNHP